MKLARLLGVVLLAVMLFGCTAGGVGGGQQGGGEETGDGPVTITMWYALGGGEEEYLQSQAEAFSEQNENIDVELLNVPFDELQRKVIQSVPSGQGPDVFYGVSDWMGTMVDGGFVADITDRYDTGAYLENTVEAVTYEGQVYAVPEAYEVVAQFYNPDIFPEPPASVEEVKEAAGSLPEGAEFPVAYDIANFYFSAPYLYATGGELFDEEGNFALTEEQATEWLTTMKEFQEQANMPDEVTGPAAVALFSDGKSGSYYSGPWDVDTFQQNDTQYELATLPTLDGEEARPFLGTKMVYVTSQTQNVDAALEWAEFFTGAENQLGWVQDVNPAHLPAIASVYEDPALAENEITQGFQAQAENAVPLPSYAAMGQVWTPAGDALNAVINGGADPAAEARKMVETIQSNIEG